MEDASHESSMSRMKESPEIKVQTKNLVSSKEETGKMLQDLKAKTTTTKLLKADQTRKASELTRHDVTQETYHHDVDAQWHGVDIKAMDEVQVDI
jgi:hypothetical protein